MEGPAGAMQIHEGGHRSQQGIKNIFKTGSGRRDNLTTHFFKAHLVLKRWRREHMVGGIDVVVDCGEEENGGGGSETVDFLCSALGLFRI